MLTLKNSTGTVAASIADIDFVKRRQVIEELFEDGTASFLSVASIRHGFNLINSLTVSAISWYAKLVCCNILHSHEKFEDPHYLVKYHVCSCIYLQHICFTSLPLRHTASLATYVRKMLLTLRHENGAAVCTLYGSHTSKVSSMPTNNL